MDNDTTILTQSLFDDLHETLLADIESAGTTSRGSAGYLVTLLDTPIDSVLPDDHPLHDVLEYFGFSEPR